MTYKEYEDRRRDIVNAYQNGNMNLPDMQCELEKLDRDYESRSPEPVNNFIPEEVAKEAAKDWSKRAEEAIAKMKARQNEIKNKWAHAYIDGDKVKVKKGPSGLPLVDMSVLEARLLACEILSLTNHKKKRS